MPPKATNQDISNQLAKILEGITRNDDEIKNIKIELQRRSELIYKAQGLETELTTLRTKSKMHDEWLLGTEKAPGILERLRRLETTNTIVSKLVNWAGAATVGALAIKLLEATLK